MADADISVMAPWLDDAHMNSSAIFLCETMRVDDVSCFFPSYTVFQQRAERTRPTPGQGMLLAVPEAADYHATCISDTNDIVAALLQDMHGTPLVLLVGMYIPPVGSPRLQEMSLLQRFAALHQLVLDHRGVPVLCAGDFNCNPLLPSASLHASTLSAFMQQSGLVLCTNRPGVDFDHELYQGEVQPSHYPANGNSPSRLDHVLACPAMLQLGLRTRVHPLNYHMSDHQPLLMVCVLPAPSVHPLSGPCTRRTPAWCWCPNLQQSYASNLRAVRHSLLSGVQSCIAQSNIGGAVDLVMQSVHTAAVTAGMPIARRACAVGRVWLPYLSPELVTLRRACRSHFRHGRAAQGLALLWQYRYEVRFRKRMWMHHRARIVVLECRQDPHATYKRLRGPQGPLPAPLRHPDAWLQYVHNLANPPNRPTPTALVLSPVPVALQHAAGILNASFTVDELGVALHKLNNNKAPGFSGAVSEFFRYAVYRPPPQAGDPPPPEHVLLQVLAAVMNAILQSGSVPPQWDLNLLTPVYKRKGNAMRCDSYRPIAVGEPLSRLLAVLLHTRLDAYLEDNQLRAPTQCGFRRKLSTMHNLFTLQHFIDKYRKRACPLYACLVDLKSAYDLVVRPVLWSVLQRKGVHGLFLQLLQSTYASCKYAVCVDGMVGEFVLSTIGVRQGCPLSPDLFAVLLDDLHEALVAVAGNDAPQLDAFTLPDAQVYPARPVPNQDFADDLILLAVSRVGLQRFVDTLATYCFLRGMLISRDKTFVVQLVPGTSLADAHLPVVVDAHVSITCNGAVLPYRGADATYLGLPVAGSTGVRDAPTHRGMTAHRAFMALRRNLPNLQCDVSVPLAVRLYCTLVRPVMLYGSEVFGLLPGALTKRRQLFAQDRQSLAAIVGVPRTVHSDALHVALRVAPLQWEMSIRVVRFWYSLFQLPRGHLFQHVALDNWRDYVARRNMNFARGLSDFLRDLGFQWLPALHSPPIFSKTDVMLRLVAKRANAMDALAADPRSAPSDGVTFCTLVRYHCLPHSYQPHDLYTLPLSRRACQVLLNFTLGVSHLPLHAGRRANVPRAQRTCPLCTLGLVANEFHMLFECPALLPLRMRFPTLCGHFNSVRCVLRLLHHPHRIAVAGFVLAALRAYAPSPHVVGVG